MKIIAFNGSPKGKKSSTSIMVENFLKGAESKKAITEQFFLKDKKIHHCIGCFHCWFKTPGKCIFKDDMDELIEKFISADIVIFATPLYVDNVTGLMKNFMDRQLPMAEPYFEKDEKNNTRHPLRSKKIASFVIISNCGFPEENNFEVLSHIFQRVARNGHTKVIAEIYKSQGPLLNTPDPNLKPIINEYKKNLQIAGAEIVENQTLSENTKKSLKKPFLDPDLYTQLVHEHFDKELRKKE
ncbi:MAG: Iron-sulfur flavoprotein [Candidatus Anoxychlamydiales bacterium]|nr:Iron-sulfur flavoprotein [Candidatus Anoxychlamydiales bacterium]